MQMYYLVNGYRFITPQKLKIHEMDPAKICVLQNIQKANFDGCVRKLG